MVRRKHLILWKRSQVRIMGKFFSVLNILRTIPANYKESLEYFSPLTGKSVLEFLNNLWGLGTEWEYGCRARSPSLAKLGPWNRFLGSLKV
jgi:hypothetical protein